MKDFRSVASRVATKQRIRDHAHKPSLEADLELDAVTVGALEALKPKKVYAMRRGGKTTARSKAHETKEGDGLEDGTDTETDTNIDTESEDQDDNGGNELQNFQTAPARSQPKQSLGAKNPTGYPTNEAAPNSYEPVESPQVSQVKHPNKRPAQISSSESRGKRHQPISVAQTEAPLPEQFRSLLEEVSTFKSQQDATNKKQQANMKILPRNMEQYGAWTR